MTSPQDAHGVDVVFAGGDRRRFDLVVGADGLHSALRTLVFGPHERFVRHATPPSRTMARTMARTTGRTPRRARSLTPSGPPR
jgi:2-polyprenyl-6-methoxyphenol hydroxylase-like FAD-dependent oxidoreductase